MARVWYFVHLWRPGTRKRCNTCFSEWFKFYSRRSDGTVQLHIKTVLEFLNKILRKGVGNSAPNTARSSLSSFLQIDTLSVGEHSFFKRFLREAYNMRSSLPKYSFTWVVGIVINFLLDFHATSSILVLSMKGPIILAVWIGKRVRGVLPVINKNIKSNIKNITFEELLHC